MIARDFGATPPTTPAMSRRRPFLLAATALAGTSFLPPGQAMARNAGVTAVAPDAGSPPPGTIMGLPLPCADQPGDIVGLLLEGAGSPAGTIAVFGQAFRPGDLPRGSRLRARMADNGRALRTQADVTTRHADGSARFAVVAIEVPVALPQGERAGVVLSSAAGGAAEPAVDPRAALAGRRAAVEIAPIGGGTPWRFDLLAAVPADAGGLSRNDVGGGGRAWQWGPLAAQWRAAALVPPAATGGATSLRVVADITARADGTLWVDAWFRNDIAQRAGGGAARFAARVLFDGREVMSFAPATVQHQYTGIGRLLAARPGPQPAAAQPFVRADARYLAEAAAVQPFDLTTGVDRSIFQRMMELRTGPAWHKPFDPRGITTYMPMTGGRADIGATTEGQAAWLITGEPVAAAFCIGQAEAAGSVPWHFWDLEGGLDRRGGWLNVKRWPGIWTDVRGGPPPGGLMQQAGETGWAPETAHQPDLAYVPFLLTGRRAFLDELLAQAAFCIVDTWTPTRTPPGFQGRPGADMIVVHNQQVRGAAWSLRQLDGAAWIVPDEDPEAPWIREAAAGNWSWLRSQLPLWTEIQGESHGWVPNDPRVDHYIDSWQQDYMASTVGAGARRGNADARAVLAWMANFLVGRFQSEAQGFAFNDGAAYRIPNTLNPNGPERLRRWGQIGEAARAAGASNGTGWERSAGDFVSLALQGLAQVIDVLNLPTAKVAYARLIAARAPFGRPDTFARMPQENIVPRGTQRFPDRLRACTAAAPLRG